jgi:hypothetical protein
MGILDATSSGSIERNAKADGRRSICPSAAAADSFGYHVSTRAYPIEQAHVAPSFHVAPDKFVGLTRSMVAAA